MTVCDTNGAQIVNYHTLNIQTNVEKVKGDGLPKEFHIEVPLALAIVCLHYA